MPPQEPQAPVDPIAAAFAADERRRREPLLPSAPPYDPMREAFGLQADPLTAGARQASVTPLDQAQRVLRLRVKTGLPDALVVANLDKLEALARAGEIEPEELRKTSPAIAAWLGGSPLNVAALSPADLAQQRALERQFQWANPLLRSIDQIQGGVFAFTETIGEFTGFDPAIELGREGRERNRLEAMAYGRRPTLTSAFDSPQDLSRYLYETIGEQLPVIGVSVAGGYGGAVAGAAIGSVVPGVGNLVGATIGGVIGAFVPSWVLGVGEVQSGLKDLDPYAVAPTTALLAGTAIGALDTVLPGKIGGRLVRTLGRESAEQAARRILTTPVKPKFWVTTARGTITGLSTEAVTEAAQEAIGGIASARGADRPVDWGALSQQMLEAAVAGGIVGGTFSGGVDALTFKREEARWMAAQQQAEFFRTLGKGVADSEFLKTLPEGGRQWMAEALKDGPIPQVYVPVAQWEEYWQQAGQSPDVVAEQVTGRTDALEQAKAAGTGLLAINTDRYATTLAATEHHDFFYKEVKLRPDIQNIREVQETVARAQEAIGKAREAAAAKTQDQQVVIKGRLVEMWVERGMSRYQAEKQATLHAERWVSRAARYGVDPVEMFEQNPTQVFYSLQSGAPLIPTPPPTAPTPGAPAAAPDPLALPDSAMTDAREATLDAAFAAARTTAAADAVPTVTLVEHGFSPEEVAALEAAGLAQDGRMTPDHYGDYILARGARLKAATAAARPVLPSLATSAAPASETRQDRARRRGLHQAALTSILTKDAQGLDPAVTPEQIRAELDRRLDYDEERQAAIRDSGRGQALLRAIAGYGGIWFNERTLGERGEVLFRAREARDVKDVRERGGRTAEAYDVREWDALRAGETVRGVEPTWNGIAGVFRKGGLAPDDMATSLRQDGQFANIMGASDLFTAIDLALSAERDTDTFPGTADLARLDITPGTRWWDTRWGMDPALTAEEVTFEDDGGDGSFDPSTFEQRARRGQLPHGATVTSNEDTGEHTVSLPGGQGEIHLIDPTRAATRAASRGTPADIQAEWEALPQGYLYVDAAAVRSPGQGDGRRLYEAAMGFALSRGAKGLSSSPRARSDQANALWRVLARDGVVTQVDGYDVVTFTGGEFFQRRPKEFRFLPEVLSPVPAPKPIPASLDKAAGLPGITAAVNKDITKRGEKLTVADLSGLIQAHVDKALAKAGFEGALDASDPRVQDYLERVLTAEGLAALQAAQGNPEAAGVGWYDLRVNQARELVGLVYPEVLTDEDAWFTFVYLLAVTSNGLLVKDNFAATARGYDTFKSTGIVPESIAAGAHADTMRKQLHRFNEQVAARGGVSGGGIASFRAELLEQHVVRDLKKREGYAHIAGLADEVVYAASMLGPKIGNGFLLNLLGIYSQMTFDRWWSRTWGRLTGSLDLTDPKLTASNRTRLRRALAALTPEERTHLEGALRAPVNKRHSNEELDALAALVRRRSGDTKGAGRLLKAKDGAPAAVDLVRRAANMLVVNKVKLRVDPLNDSERAQMNLVARRALANIQAAGYPDLTPADFQAVEWYPEKLLYAKAKAGEEVGDGYDEQDAPDYANNAEIFARAAGFTDADIAGARTRGRSRATTQPAGKVQPAVGPVSRPAPGTGARKDVDPGEFFQRAGGPASSTLQAFYSRLALPVREAKVEAAKGRDWKALIKGAKTGINLDEYRAVGVDLLDDGTTYTRAEVLDFLKAHEVHLEVVELASPSELIDPAMLRREADAIHAEMVNAAIVEAEENDRGPRLYSDGDIEVGEETILGETVYTVEVDGQNIASWQTFETEAAARAEAESWIEDFNAQQERNWRIDISNDISYDEAETQARESLEEQYRDREAHFTTLVQPNAVEGTYREVFITAPNARKNGAPLDTRGERLDAFIAGLDAMSVVEPGVLADVERLLAALRTLRDSGNFAHDRIRNFHALTTEQNDLLWANHPAMMTELQLEPGDARWHDGHDGYSGIANPVVRLRYTVRRLPAPEVRHPTTVQPPAAPGAPWLVQAKGETLRAFRTQPEAEAWAAQVMQSGGALVDSPFETVLFLEEVQPPQKDTGDFGKMPEVFQNNWRELAMRFALQHAATQGYDRVAWTNGEQQMIRYHLRQVADRIVYHPTEQRLVAFSKDNTQLLDRLGVAETDLRRFIGEPAAAKLLQADVERNYSGNPSYTLRTANIPVDLNDGLARLYDAGLGNVANKLPAMRRSKVSTTTMVLPGMSSGMVYEGPEVSADTLLADANADVRDVSPTAMGVTLAAQARQVAGRIEGGLTFAAAMAVEGSPALATRYGGTLSYESQPATVPGYTLTPALRDTVLTRGQEFFQAKRTRRRDGNTPYDDTLTGAPLVVDPMAPTLATRVEMVTQSVRTLGAAVVHSPADAAAAMAYLARGAQERFDGLLTDEDGTPLALIGGFKGTIDQTMVHPDVLLAEALNVPGAAHLWLAHNHPSGNPTLSQADRQMAVAIAARFANSGITVDGALAIGSGFGAERHWSFTVPHGLSARDQGGAVRVEPAAATAVPVQEREFVAVDKLDTRPLTTPALAASVVSTIADGRFGVVFTDIKLRAIGFAPLDPATATALKDEGRARALYQTWAQSGAARAFVYAPERGQRAAAVNVINALTAIDVEVIDLIDHQGSGALPLDAMSGVFTQPLEGGEGGIPPGVRGSYNRMTGWIRLIAGAENLSTFLHESGHAFLHELFTDALSISLRDPATTTDLQQGLVKDAHTILRWFSFEGTIGDFLALSTDQQRAMHEQWARSFEVYLTTGQAPSAELRSIFATFRAWLLTVYKLMTGATQAQVEAALSKEAGFTVTLPTEVREVMDRLLASDEAIAAARAEREVVPLFTDAATAGVDPLTFAAYQKLVEEAHIKAREILDAKLLAEWRQAQTAEWEREREAVRDQVVHELNTNPVVVALSVIRTGKLPDGQIPSFGDGAPLKLSKDGILALKGQAFLRRLPRPYLYTVTGGLHPDIVAELVGFTSGDAMLEALVDARPPRMVIEAETDQRMREQHGDELLSGLELKDLAEQALHEHRSEVIAAELQALTRGLTATAVPSVQALRAEAERRVARLQVRELTPGLFLQAATRASQKAFDAFARNDRAAAVQFKIQELSSLALYRAAAQAKERAGKTANLMREFQTSPGRRKNLLRAGPDYLDQVDTLLERYEFTKVSQRSQERRISLRKWVETQQANGLPVDIPEWVIDDSRTLNYTRLTTEELEGVRASVEHIAHLARLKKRLLDARDQRELEEIQQEITASITALHTQRATVHEPRIGLASTRAFTAGIHYSHLKLATIARLLDGLQDGGPMWSFVIRRLNEAADQEAARQGVAGVALTQLFERFYRPGERAQFNAKRAVPELNVLGQQPISLSKQALLMVALNQGNETNRQRLRDGYGWTQEQVAKALDNHLEQRDFDFVQAVWDYIDSYWPDIVAKQQRIAGLVPEKVLATPVFTRFGEYRGGYFPITFDSEQSGRNLSLDLRNAAKLAEAAAYVHATTARGHLERRVEGPVTENPVRLDFGVITQHLSQVIHDLTHHEMLIDVGRILDVKGPVAAAITDTLGPKAYEQFMTGMRDIALGDPPARHETEGLMGWLKGGSTVVGLAWNVMSSAIQWVGYTQTVYRIGPTWAARGLVSFFRGALTMESTTKNIMAESVMMQTRFDNLSPELADLRERLGIHNGRFAGWVDAGLRTVTADVITKQGIANSYMLLIQKAQMLVDIPTYLGARAKAMADPANKLPDGTIDEARCVALAEQAVLDAQGGGQTKDLAAVQRGPISWKAWINFYSFFNTTYQHMTEAGVRYAAHPLNPIAVGRLAVDVLLLISAPTILTHLTRSVLQGTLGDELDDPDELAWALIREQITYMLGMMVIVRELGGYMEGLARYEGPAGMRGIPTIGRAIGTLQRELQRGGITPEAALRSLNAVGGVLLHYPASQIDKTVRGMYALASGKTQDPRAVLFGPPPPRR